MDHPAQAVILAQHHRLAVGADHVAELGGGGLVDALETVADVVGGMAVAVGFAVPAPVGAVGEGVGDAAFGQLYRLVVAGPGDGGHIGAVGQVAVVVVTQVLGGLPGSDLRYGVHGGGGVQEGVARIGFVGDIAHYIETVAERGIARDLGTGQPVQVVEGKGFGKTQTQILSG